MSSLLPSYSFLSPLKRQRAVRNRNNNATDTPSKRANRLPVLPELAGEQDVFCSAPSSASSSSLCSASSSSRCTTPNKKRLSRYGKDEFAFGGAFSVTDDFLSTAPRAAPRPPPSTTKQMHQSVRLSAFDFVLDISASEPVSPVRDKPVTSSTPPCDTRGWSPSPSHSPTPSLTSVSACSSTEMPATPGASDDESPILRLPRKVISRPDISIHPLVLTKSTLTSETSPADTFEFALAPFPESGDENAGREDQGEEDDALWYSQELSQVVSLSSRSVTSNSPARPDSLLPPPRCFSSGKDRPYGRSRMSKPLPAIPLPPGPSPQLDPTFPRCKSRPPRLPIRATPLPASPSSPLALHPPAVTPEPETPSYVTSAAPSASARNSLTDRPRALPHSPLPLDVSDILDNDDVWSFATPSTSISTSALSPPHVPYSPASSLFSEEYDPIELIVSYAAQPPSPAISTTNTITASVTLLQDGDEEAEAETDCMTGDGDKLRSRWSCSTLATLVPPSSTPPTSPSARLRFHLGSVARRVRSRRAGGSNGDEDAVDVPKVVAHICSSSEPAMSGSVCVPDDDAAAFLASGTRRKPIPLDLFFLQENGS